MIFVKHLPKKGVISEFITDENSNYEKKHVFTSKFHYVRYQPFGDIYPNGELSGELISRYIKLNKETR